MTGAMAAVAAFRRRPASHCTDPHQGPEVQHLRASFCSCSCSWTPRLEAGHMDATYRMTSVWAGFSR